MYLNVNESVEDNEVLLGGDKMHMNIRLRFCYVRRHTCGHVEFNASLFTSNKLGVIYYQSIVLLTFRLVAGMKLVNTELYYIALLSSLFSFTVAMHFRFLYHLYMQLSYADQRNSFKTRDIAVYTTGRRAFLR